MENGELRIESVDKGEMRDLWASIDSVDRRSWWM